MNIILLSGGSGKRLWPLSNEVRSKQFLKIFKKGNTGNNSKESGLKESMVQRMYRMIREVAPDSVITIATSKDQIPQIQSQLGDNINISIEPCRKDTFPAIALASAFLHDKLDVDKNEAVVVCPVDPYVEEDYFECLKRLSDEVDKTDKTASDKAGLVLMGIQPTYPATKYGYIIPAEVSASVSNVLSFKEKPDEKTAEAYIAQGALWNGGVFAFKLDYILSIASSLLGSSDYDSLYNNYESLNRISFDYAVAEKEKHIRVIRFNASWKDLGTWNTLTDAMDEPTTGNAIAQDCTNTHVINELSLPLVALGMKDCVIAATHDGILVSDKEKSTQLKDVLNKDIAFSDSRPMYERRTWGEYKVLDYKLHKDNQNSLVKELIISPGQHISYQRHSHRTEIWTFTEGAGELILDGKIKRVVAGDVAIIKPGMKHAIKGLTEFHIIEVQLGDELTEDDIERLTWDWV